MAGDKGSRVMAAMPGASRAVGRHPIKPAVKLLDKQTISVKWGPAGWVRILNDRTAPHFIGPKGRGVGSLRKQNSIKGSRRASAMSVASLLGGTIGAGTHGAINISGVGPRAYAFHPGTKGKHFVEPGKVAARPVMTATFHEAAVTNTLRSTFHG